MCTISKCNNTASAPRPSPSSLCRGERPNTPLPLTPTCSTCTRSSLKHTCSRSKNVHEVDKRHQRMQQRDTPRQIPYPLFSHPLHSTTTTTAVKPPWSILLVRFLHHHLCRRLHRRLHRLHPRVAHRGRLSGSAGLLHGVLHSKLVPFQVPSPPHSHLPSLPIPSYHQLSVRPLAARLRPIAPHRSRAASPLSTVRPPWVTGR